MLSARDRRWNGDRTLGGKRRGLSQGLRLQRDEQMKSHRWSARRGSVAAEPAPRRNRSQDVKLRHLRTGKVRETLGEGPDAIKPQCILIKPVVVLMIYFSLLCGQSQIS